MANLNLEEQEQITKLQYFWKDYGKYIISLLLVAIVVYASSALWAYKSQNDAAAAALIYAKFTTAVENNDSNGVYLSANQLQREYPKTEYTSFASLLAAKVAFTAHNFAQASEYLNWLIKHAKDKSLVSIAKLRLVDVYLDQSQIKPALAITVEKVSPDFQGLFYAKRGDVYVVAKDKLKAVDAYKAALSSAEGYQDLRDAIQMKLDVLGN
jgi:predicted negative regulator of RcsB-dependent stress response